MDFLKAYGPGMDLVNPPLPNRAEALLSELMISGLNTLEVKINYLNKPQIYQSSIFQYLLCFKKSEISNAE